MIGLLRGIIANTQCDHTCYSDSLVLSKWRKMPIA
jgi:hypothetical protein